MKIAFVVDTFPRLSETFIDRELLALGERGVDVQVFALHRGADVDTPLAAATVFGTDIGTAERFTAFTRALVRHPCTMLRLVGRAVRLLGCCPRAGLLTLRVLGLAAAFAHRATQSNRMHVHAHFAYVTADTALVMSALMGCRFSVSAHAWDIHAQGRRTLRARLSRAAGVAACSEDGRAAICAALPPGNRPRVQLLRHGLDLEQFEPVQPAGRLILGIGRLVEKKGFIYLLEACAALARSGVDFDCVIAGDGPERTTLDAAVDRLRLGDRVVLKGPVSRSEAVALYRRARVFALPCVVASDGDRDGVPNTILEAMATGLPVVAGTAGATGEAVEDGVTGFLVDAHDADTLAARLRVLLEDAAMCQQFGLAGRTVIQERFNIETNSVALKQFFESVNS